MELTSKRDKQTAEESWRQKGKEKEKEKHRQRLQNEAYTVWLRGCLSWGKINGSNESV